MTAGQFLSKALDGICKSCHVRIRPQVFQEIRQSLQIHACSSCRRIFYHEPSLLKAAAAVTAPSPAAPAETSNVEALDRGPV